MNMAFSSVAGSGDPVLTFALVCGGRFANVRTKGAPEISDSDAVLDLAFAPRTSGTTEANAKSTAPCRRVSFPGRWRRQTHGQGLNGFHAGPLHAHGKAELYDRASISA